MGVMETSNDDLRKEYEDLVVCMVALNAKVDEKLKRLEAMEQHYHATLEKVNENKALQQRWVELNVGGRVFAASKDTLTRWEGTYFHGLLCGGFWNPSIDGAHHIDRDPTYFDRILTSLRTGNPVDFSGLTLKESEDLRAEMDYYQLEPAVAGTFLRWDSGRCSANLTISEDGRTIVKTNGSNAKGSSCLLASSPDTASFKVRLKGNGNTILGYVKASAFGTDDCHSSGWWVWFHSKRGPDSDFADRFDNMRVYITGDLEAKIVTVNFEKTLRTISFAVDSELCGVFTGIDCDSSPLFPCAGLFCIGSSVTLEQ